MGEMPWSVAVSSVHRIRKRKSVCLHVGDTDFDPFQPSVFQSVDFFQPFVSPYLCGFLSSSASVLLSFSFMFILRFFFFYPGPFGLLTSGSVSLFISGPLWFPFLPAAASAPLDFGPVSPSSLPSTERCTRPLGPATRLTHS